MGELLIMNLSAILIGAAILITAVGTFLNTWMAFRNRHTLAETKAEVVAVHKKVDDGAKEVQRAMTEIAKTAVAAASTRAVRATDRKVEP